MRSDRSHRRKRPAGRRPAPKKGQAAAALLLLILLGALALFIRWEAFSEGSAGEIRDGTSFSEDVRAEVRFFDVGQGDSALIRFPGAGNGYTVLIDTGEREYADGLCETLEDLGVARIDALVMSHPHSDHMGAMGELMRQLPVGRLYMPVVPEEHTPTTRAYERVLDAALEENIPVTRLVRGTAIEVPEGAALTAFSPEEDADWEEMNNYSAVLKLTVGETAFLFAGDAEAESEALILAAGCDVSADVLKCGHHGSSTSTSSAFLEAVAPEAAVISCGAENPYGHPHRETVEKLKEADVDILRTDRDGTVCFVTDGERLSLKTGLPGVRSSEEDF